MYQYEMMNVDKTNIRLIRTIDVINSQKAPTISSVFKIFLSNLKFHSKCIVRLIIWNYNEKTTTRNVKTNLELSVLKWIKICLYIWQAMK